jgi:sugar O-acyltransferase (sialic acid O-acetyltransferase NeuD family)
VQSERIVIYGNGSIARLLHSYPEFGEQVVGFTVDSEFLDDGREEFCGKPMVPFESVQDTFPPDNTKIIVAVGFVEMNNIRQQKSEEARAKGYAFTRFIHKSVEQKNGIEIGENVIILDHVSIHTGSKIGDGTFISSNVNIGHDCIIGAYNWINSGVSIAGFVTVGDRSFWGVNSSIADSVSVGVETFIGANTLVTRSSDDETVHISEASKLFPMKSRKFLKFIARKQATE